LLSEVKPFINTERIGKMRKRGKEGESERDFQNNCGLEQGILTEREISIQLTSSST
jgi:hypothetical protein